MDRNEVSTAFEIVMEEVESVVDNLNEEGSESFRKGDYDKARGLIEYATRLTDFRGRVRNLQKEWENLFTSKIPAKKGRKKKITSRLNRGLRTSEDAFRRPILEVLSASGGSGKVSDVLDRVGDKVKDALNDNDCQQLPSYPHEIRWRNTAQWCRNTLVQEGLLKNNSPRGVWEISEKGRSAIKTNDV
jgi:restriction system protein